MVTYLFPGQGSQAPQMGRSLAEAFDVAKRTFEEADDALGFSISQLCFEGSEDELKRTEITQPAILTTSIAALRVLESKRPELSPTFAAGHSLGEWSALVAVGALAFADAVRLVNIRGRLMQEAVPEGQGAMAAVVGVASDDVIKIASESSSNDARVVAANFNSPEQTVISGSASAVEIASARLAEAFENARVIPLSVSAPFHSPLMAPAAEGLKAALEPITISAMKAPVVSNVEAQPNQDLSRVKSLLVEQVTGCVRWVETVKFLVASNEKLAFEIGPGKVLMGLGRRIDRGLSIKGIQDPKSLEKALASLDA